MDNTGTRSAHHPDNTEMSNEYLFYSVLKSYCQIMYLVFKTNLISLTLKSKNQNQKENHLNDHFHVFL